MKKTGTTGVRAAQAPAKKATRAAAKSGAVTQAATRTGAVKQAATRTGAMKQAASKKTAATRVAATQVVAKRPSVSKRGTKTSAVPEVVVRKSVPNPLVPKRRDDASDALPPLPRVPAGMRLGTHVSSQGGSFAAPPRATEIGATALQLFTKTPNQWKEREIDVAEASAFRSALEVAGNPVTVSHDSYLINLASPDDVMRARSLESFTMELRRCHALGIHFLVTHPGNYMDDRDAGIARNAAAITSALQAEPGPTIVCLETTAGTGTALGATFEELAAIIAAIPSPLRTRIGVCVDTCHIHSAGYDLVNDFDGVIATFDRVLGLDRLRVWHLNDSKTPFNSHRDRHELIGEGSLGELPFRRIMTDPRFAHTVRILETPKLDDATRTDRTMLNRLLSFLPSA